MDNKITNTLNKLWVVLLRVAGAIVCLLAIVPAAFLIGAKHLAEYRGQAAVDPFEAVSWHPLVTATVFPLLAILSLLAIAFITLVIMAWGFTLFEYADRVKGKRAQLIAPTIV